jgi:MFS family permease
MNDGSSSSAESQSSSNPPESRYAVLGLRDFRLFLGGRFAANLGQQMLGVAVGWELYERTGSPLALGLVGLAQIVPMLLLALPAGHTVDVRDRRTIIIITQIGIGACGAGLALTSWQHAPVAMAYLLLAAMGAFRAFSWPATSALLPRLVPRTLMAKAVAWNSGMFQMSAAAGPALGGLLIAWTGKAVVVYALHAITAFACAVLLVPVRMLAAEPEAGPAEEPTNRKMSLKSLLAGISFVWRTPVIFGAITLDLFAVLLGGATALLPVYAKDILHAGPDGLGVLQAALPVGSVSMALFLAHRPPLERAGHAMLGAVAGFGIATIIFGLSRWYLLSWAMLFACGALDNISVVVRHTLVPLLTPDAMRGRVNAVNSLFISASNELGGFESGFVASVFGPVVSVVSGGIGTVLVVVAIALVWPELRRFGRLDETPQAA